MSFQIKKAVRTEAKTRIAITSPSGGGKTYGALLLAKGLGGKICIIDTERGSASLYAGLEGMPEFDTLELGAPYTPERYIEAIKAVEDSGYEICIVDSMTHEWSGIGGCLELTDSIAKAKYRGNTWSAWNDVTPRHRKFIDSMIASPMHIITTMRSKTDTIQNKDVNGKTRVEKVGMKTEQRDGIEYEFTVVFDINDHDTHTAIASKDRTGMFTDPLKLNEDTGKRIKEWLSTASRIEPVKETKPVAPAPEPEESSAISEEELTVIRGIVDAWSEAKTVDELTELAKDTPKGLGDEAKKQLRMMFKDIRARLN